MKTGFFLFVFAMFISCTSIFSNQDGGCKIPKPEEKPCKDPKKKKVCCKIKYAGGGYDYFISSEQDCRANENFHMILDEKDTLCLDFGNR